MKLHTPRQREPSSCLEPSVYVGLLPVTLQCDARGSRIRGLYIISSTRPAPQRLARAPLTPLVALGPHTHECLSLSQCRSLSLSSLAALSGPPPSHGTHRCHTRARRYSLYTRVHTHCMERAHAARTHAHKRHTHTDTHKDNRHAAHETGAAERTRPHLSLLPKVAPLASRPARLAAASAHPRFPLPG